jgi:hypothetical protein
MLIDIPTPSTFPADFGHFKPGNSFGAAPGWDMPDRDNDHPNGMDS